MTSEALPTVGVIAARLGQPLHRVQYIVRARGIEPAGRAGNVRVFLEEDVERIARELGCELPAECTESEEVRGGS